MESPQEFAIALNTANEYARHLVAVVAAIQEWLASLGLGDAMLGNTTPT